MIKFNIMQPLKCCAYNLNSHFDNKYFIVSMKNCLRHDLAFMMRPGVMALLGGNEISEQQI